MHGCDPSLVVLAILLPPPSCAPPPMHGCDPLSCCTDGLVLFEDFLKSEFSEENIQFWKACQRFKTVPMETLSDEAKAIHDEYILQRAPKWVSP